MKYWIFKIVGILGLIATPILMNSHYDAMRETGSIVARNTWYDGCVILLVIFLVITIAGFARSIAKIKAFIDFHTDFDDDQDLDGHPKLRIFSLIRKIFVGVALTALLVFSILNNKVAFVTNNYNIIILVLGLAVLVVFLVSIVICLAMGLVPLYFDMAVFMAVLGFLLDAAFIYFGLHEVVSMMITSPIFAISALYFSSMLDDFISIDEVFDWICDDTYDEYYKKLCDKEKAKNAEKELSANKQAKQKKIENKPIVRAERKEAKQVKKAEKKTAKQTKKTNKKTLEKK